MRYTERKSERSHTDFRFNIYEAEVTEVIKSLKELRRTLINKLSDHLSEMLQCSVIYWIKAEICEEKTLTGL